jgi:hypothetical protein
MLAGKRLQPLHILPGHDIRVGDRADRERLGMATASPPVCRGRRPPAGWPCRRAAWRRYSSRQGNGTARRPFVRRGSQSPWVERSASGCNVTAGLPGGRRCDPERSIHLNLADNAADFVDGGSQQLCGAPAPKATAMLPALPCGGWKEASCSRIEVATDVS